MIDQEKTIQDILEIVTFIKDTGATKEDLTNEVGRLDNRIDKLDGRIDKLDGRIDRIERTMVTKDELTETKNELMTHMDGFIGLHQKLDTEFTFLRSRCDRLEAAIQIMAAQLKIQVSL